METQPNAEGGTSQPAAAELNLETTQEEIEFGGGGANEDVDEEVADLVSQVHMKLTVQLESRMRDLESATYCTLFLLIDSEIVTDMQDADRAYNERSVSSWRC